MDLLGRDLLVLIPLELLLQVLFEARTRGVIRFFTDQTTLTLCKRLTAGWLKVVTDRATSA